MFEKKEYKNDLDVLIMCDNCLETIGGEQESTKIILKGIKQNYNTGIIQPGELKKPIQGIKNFNLTKKTRIKHLIKNPVSFLKYILKIKKIIRKTNPKIIHTQAQVSFFIVSLLSKLNLIDSKIKIIHTERGLYTKYNTMFKAIFLFFLTQTDVLVTTTNFNMKSWENAISKRLKNSKLEFQVIENTAGELFEKYDGSLIKKNEENLVVGFAGRYCDWKNWPLAVEIIEKLNSLIGENLHIKMAVGCLDEKSEKETKKMFFELNELYGERFTGNINIDLVEMNKFYYELDVFILTSNYNTESFGRTLVEAMSRKTVVLTTNAGGAVEVVGNMSNVIEDSGKFADRINFLFHNKKFMSQEKEKNYERVAKTYSLKNNIQKHEELYEKNLN